MKISDSLHLKGLVHVKTGDGQDVWTENVITLFTVNALSSWLTGIANTQSATNAILSPKYLTLGTGTGTPANTDESLYTETFGMRQSGIWSVVPAPSGSSMVGNAAELTVQYTPSEPNGTFTEVGIVGAPNAELSMDAAGSGNTSITVSANSLAWFLGEQMYIDDAANPEYASVASPVPSQGGTQITLASALQYAHAAGTPVYVFVPPLWTHAVFSASVTKSANYLMTVTYYLGFST